MSTRAQAAEPWWDAPKDACDGDLLKTADTLRTYEDGRRKDMALHLALYGDAIAKRHVSSARVNDQLDKERLCFNLVKAVCDAAQAQIASQSTRARVLTQKGNWSLQQRAQALEHYLDGVYEENDVHTEAAMGFLDAAKVGATGFKVYPVDGRMCVDLVRPGEVIVDPVDGQYRNPRCLYQECFLPRAVVMGLYGRDDKKRRAIETASKASGERLFPWLPHDTTIDTIRVVEAWRRPDPEDWHQAKTGRHVVAIEGATLLDEDWDRGFPFVFWRYDTESVGFWGRGLAQNLRSMQRELNYTLLKLQECMRLNSGYRVLIDRQSKVSAEEITDSPGEVIYYDSRNGAAPPQYQVSNTVPDQFFRHVEDIIRRGFEQEGVSLLGATSRKPAGLDSGAAIREYNDVEAARFVVKAKAYERFIGVHLARLIIVERAAAADADKPVRVEVQRRRGVSVKEINWADAEMDAKDYSVQVFPASALPIQPAGRMATVEGWMAAGLIDRDQAMRLLDFPDLDEFQATELAPHEIILDAVERMIDEGAYVPPEPVQDLQLTAKLTINAYQRHMIDGAPEDRTELLLRYIEDARAMFAEAQALMAANQQQAAPQPQQQVA